MTYCSVARSQAMAEPERENKARSPYKTTVVEEFYSRNELIYLNDFGEICWAAVEIEFGMPSK